MFDFMKRLSRYNINVLTEIIIYKDEGRRLNEKALKIKYKCVEEDNMRMTISLTLMRSIITQHKITKDITSMCRGRKHHFDVISMTIYVDYILFKFSLHTPIII